MSTAKGQIRKLNLDSVESRRVKRPRGYVDPPEVIALHQEYIRRAKERGRPITQPLCAILLGSARAVYAHPERYNRWYTFRTMTNMKGAPKRRSQLAKNRERARRLLPYRRRRRAETKAAEENPLHVPEIKQGRFLPLG